MSVPNNILFSNIWWLSFWSGMRRTKRMVGLLETMPIPSSELLIMLDIQTTTWTNPGLKMAKKGGSQTPMAWPNSQKNPWYGLIWMVPAWRDLRCILCTINHPMRKMDGGLLLILTVMDMSMIGLLHTLCLSLVSTASNLLWNSSKSILIQL